jgi:hypothetical protein
VSSSSANKDRCCDTCVRGSAFLITQRSQAIRWSDMLPAALETHVRKSERTARIYETLTMIDTEHFEEKPYRYRH